MNYVTFISAVVILVKLMRLFYEYARELQLLKAKNKI